MKQIFRDRRVSALCKNDLFKNGGHYCIAVKIQILNLMETLTIIEKLKVYETVLQRLQQVGMRWSICRIITQVMWEKHTDIIFRCPLTPMEFIDKHFNELLKYRPINVDMGQIWWDIKSENGLMCRIRTVESIINELKVQI